MNGSQKCKGVSSYSKRWFDHADLTNLDPAALQLMTDNGLISVPVFLIYNLAFPREPIILKDLVSEEQLLEAIRYNSGRTQNKAMDAKE